MATQGYEPYSFLWHLFHQDGRPLKPEDLTKFRSLVGYITESRSHPDGSSFVDRFMTEMPGRTKLTIEQADIAQGLLECLNPYQAYSPHTMAASVDFKMGGLWDHFKGGIYLITGFSSWASGNNEPVVEYLSMLFGTKHTRLVSQWCEVVQWPDKKYRSRFVKRGPDLRTPEPPYKVPSPTSPPA